MYRKIHKYFYRLLKEQDSLKVSNKIKIVEVMLPILKIMRLKFLLYDALCVK